MSNPLLDTPAEFHRLALRHRDAAQALGVSERTLWDWMKRGTIPHVRIGKTILYPVAELTAWLKTNASAVAIPTEGGQHDAH